MEKSWIVAGKNQLKQYSSYDDAEKQAKRSAGKPQPYCNTADEIFIFESVAVAKAPVPDVEVTKIT